MASRMDEDLLRTFSLALGIGLLIGFQRRRTGSGMGGIRTCSLIALTALDGGRARFAVAGVSS